MPDLDTPSPTSTATWAGRLLSGLVIAFMLFDGAIKLVPLAPVIDTMNALGFATTTSLARGLGVLVLLCTLLYAVPRTAALGAILMTGYLGGAIAIQLRSGSPLFTHLLFGVYLGLMLWAGLLLLDGRLRSVLFG